jgi:hypothetical protein
LQRSDGRIGHLPGGRRIASAQLAGDDGPPGQQGDGSSGDDVLDARAG